MTLYFVKIFYFILGVLLLGESSTFVSEELTNITFTIFAAPFNYVDNKSVLFPIIYILTVLSFLLFYIKSNKFNLIIMSILSLIFISMKYSFGKISHSYHIWMFCIILLMFLDVRSKMNTKKNLILFRASQGLLLSTYFISGLWKVRGLFNDNFSVPIFKIGLNHIAASAAEGNSVNSDLFSLIVLFPNIIAFGFILIIIFQLSCIVPIVKMKFYNIYLFLIILFHFSTNLTMKILYAQQLVLAIVLLYLLELFIFFEKNPNLIGGIKS